MASSRGVVLHPILEFKENLSVLLISSLFILLSSRLDLSMFNELGWRGPLFVLVMILIVRPVSVLLSTIGAGLQMSERLFLSWLAPRGIVAAAVASVFAIRLGMDVPVVESEVDAMAANVVSDSVTAAATPLDAPGAGLVPATFLVIFGTVAVYGLTAAPVARRLGLASASPQGVVIAGADPIAQRIGSALQEAGFPVLLVDTNRWNIRNARMAGLNTAHENILSEHGLEELDLGGIGRFLGMTANDEVNALAAMHLTLLFGRANVYQLPSHNGGDNGEAGSGHLRGRTLFRPDLTHRQLESHFEQGARLKATKLTDEFTFEQFLETHGESAIPLFLCGQGKLSILTAREAVTPKPGQTVIALITLDAEREPSVADGDVENPSETPNQS